MSSLGKGRRRKRKKAMHLPTYLFLRFFEIFRSDFVFVVFGLALAAKASLHQKNFAFSEVCRKKSAEGAVAQSRSLEQTSWTGNNARYES
jgi:hypothetical protein